MTLLRRIKEQMCPAIRALSTFFEPGEGIESFKDLEDRISMVSLRDIKHALSGLIELEHKLSSMSSSWQESATIVSHHDYLQYTSNFNVAQSSTGIREQ